jgi:hypothetical protein
MGADVLYPSSGVERKHEAPSSCSLKGCIIFYTTLSSLTVKSITKSQDFLHHVKKLEVKSITKIKQACHQLLRVTMAPLF